MPSGKLIEPLVPAAKAGGPPPPRYERREIVQRALFTSIKKRAAPGRNLPHDLPPWSLVHYYFWHWKQGRATWQSLHDRLREQMRVKLGT